MASTLVAPPALQAELEMKLRAAPTTAEKPKLNRVAMAANVLKAGCRFGVNLVIQGARAGAEHVRRAYLPTEAESLADQLLELNGRIEEARKTDRSLSCDDYLSAATKCMIEQRERIGKMYTTALRSQIDGEERDMPCY
jgi:hypothetical protein